MLRKNPFIKYVMKDDDKGDFFHSSAYAKAQTGEGIGAASTESYQVRVKINENRQNIKGYGESELMKNTRNQDLRAKAYVPPKDGGAGAMGPKPGAAGAAMPPKNPGISFKK